jgi:gamma-glutamyltranspeptidase
MTRVAIAAPHVDAVSAAEDAVRVGGNALDAALAAAAVLAVTYPHQCSLGGDLTALVSLPDRGQVVAVLSIGAAPGAIDVEMLVAAGTGMPNQGPLAVTVPGVVAGWITLAELGARLGLQRPLEHAAALAEEGVRVPPGLARAIDARRSAIGADPGLSGLLMRDRHPLREGSSLRQPALAHTLRELATDPASFYEGSVAARFAAGLAELGSPLTEADLLSHEADQATPLTLWVGETCWWAPPPPAQGATALALIDDSDPRDLFVRARDAHAARDRLLGDPRGGQIDVDAMLHPSGGVLAGSARRAAGDTVAVATVDDEGRSVTLVQSVFQTLGAGLLEPRTGIVLHNRGAAFTLDPGGGHPGRLQPRIRPPHTLCPLLAEAPGMRVAIGCQGGRVQPLILAQLAGQASDRDAALDQMLSAPRWVVGSRDLDLSAETVLYEPGAQPRDLDGLPAAAAAGPDDRCGHVQIARAIGTRLEAASDPRADGRAAVVKGG